MKVLIINGSPRVGGDTEYILSEFRKKFPIDTEFEEIKAFNENIKPCIDCRYCWRHHGCNISDGMDVILKDDYDVLVMASPLYMSYITPPLFSIITRLNFLWCNSYFLKKQNNMKHKKGVLILSGGGDGHTYAALDIIKTAFKFLNVSFDDRKDYIYSLNTNDIPVRSDKTIPILIDKAISDIINYENKK